MDQLSSNKDWVIKGLCVFVWGIFFFLRLFTSILCKVRNTLCASPLAMRPWKTPLGFLVAPTGSRQLKMVKTEEDQRIGQGHKWMATPTARSGWGGRGKGNTDHQHPLSVMGLKRNAWCFCTLIFKQYLWHPWLPTPPQTSKNRNSGKHESYISKELLLLFFVLCKDFFGIKECKRRSSGGTGQLILWNKTITPPWASWFCFCSNHDQARKKFHLLFNPLSKRCYFFQDALNSYDDLLDHVDSLN